MAEQKSNPAVASPTPSARPWGTWSASSLLMAKASWSCSSSSPLLCGHACSASGGAPEPTAAEEAGGGGGSETQGRQGSPRARPPACSLAAPKTPTGTQTPDSLGVGEGTVSCYPAPHGRKGQERTALQVKEEGISGTSEPVTWVPATCGACPWTSSWVPTGIAPSISQVGTSASVSRAG